MNDGAGDGVCLYWDATWLCLRTVSQLIKTLWATVDCLMGGPGCRLLTRYVLKIVDAAVCSLYWPTTETGNAISNSS